MTDDQINVAIAEICGWRLVEKQYEDFGYCLRVWVSPFGQEADAPPNYCSDLNAMHEAEKVLTLKRLLIYAEWLESEYGFFGITATARQRAEALLCTLGKWEKAK
jgi:hypothetical protein